MIIARIGTKLRGRTLSAAVHVRYYEFIYFNGFNIDNQLVKSFKSIYLKINSLGVVLLFAKSLPITHTL